LRHNPMRGLVSLRFLRLREDPSARTSRRA
jgi:hypothetical protein